MRRFSKRSVVAMTFVGFLVVAVLMWADKNIPLAGVWALMLLSISVGFVHGALDAVLMPQRFSSRGQAAFMFAAYLLLVLLLGWVLGSDISLALSALLLMSAWHFGEPYGRWSALLPWQRGLTRTVVGGAPVMLPIWLAPGHLATVLADVVPALGLQGWRNLALTWLVLLALWLLACGVVRWRSLRYAWLELDRKSVV